MRRTEELKMTQRFLVLPTKRMNCQFNQMEKQYVRNRYVDISPGVLRRQLGIQVRRSRLETGVTNVQRVFKVRNCKRLSREKCNGKIKYIKKSVTCANKNLNKLGSKNNIS